MRKKNIEVQNAQKIERSEMRSNRDKLREHRKVQGAQLLEGPKGALEIGISAHK